MRAQPARRSTAVARIAAAALLTATSLSASACAVGGGAFGGRAVGAEAERVRASPRHNGHRFVNPRDTRILRSGVSPDFLSTVADATPACVLPVPDPAAVRASWARPSSSGLRVTWLGHSALLIEIDGVVVLTDPAFSPRCSPFSDVGPERFHPPIVDVTALPAIDAVLISHDHYDHLDMATVQAIAMAQPRVRFLVPLGVAAHLEAWGIPPARVTSHDWGEATVLEAAPIQPARPGGSVRVTSTPAQHFSGRSLLDQNATLWTSWVIRGRRHRVFFSGDTGLTPQFADIGAAHGPFDVAFLEVGAYHPSWGDIHLGPDNAMRAWALLRARRLWPVHWGTFNLGLHPWRAPIERTLALAAELGVPVVVPGLGVPTEPLIDPDGPRWWRSVCATATHQ